MELIVGVGEYLVTNREDDIIKTFALASCVAVTAYSPLRKAAGMIHVVLPFPLDSNGRKVRPSYFAETGIPLLISTMCRKYGCLKEELQIQMYGGAASMIHQDIFNIGKKNIDAAKHILVEMGLTIFKTDLYGNEIRSLSMEVKTGSIKVFRQPILN